MRSLDSMRHAYTSPKFALTVFFDRSTGAPYFPRPASFSNFNPLRISHNPHRLHGRHECEGRFHVVRGEFQRGHVEFGIFELIKCEPLCCDLRQRIRRQHEQSKFDHHQFRHEFSHNFASQRFRGRLFHRRSGLARESESRR